jgi:serine/threonine protein phosphatase PrpC
LTEFQRKHARRHLQPNLLRGLGEIDLPAASVFSFALFLLDVFLGIQGQTRAELQDALEKCRSRSGTGIPPGLPELFRPLVTASAGKPLGWTCRDLVAAVLRSYRDSPFICSPTFVLTVSHSRFAYSVPGLNKEGSNEDRYHVCRCGQATLLAVADGVSTADLGSGSLAAEEIVRWLDLTGRKRFEAAVARCLAEATAWPEEAERFLGEFFQSAHQHVIDQINGLFQGWTEAEPPKHPMCSTLVSAFVLGDQAIIRHVGDSPAWLYSPARNLFCKLTEEHHAGRERAFTFESDRQETALTRVIGDCELALSGKEYVAVEPRADLVRVQLRPGDLLLLSSDGLVDGIDEPETHARVTRLEGETRRLVQAGTDLKKLVRKLMALAEEGRSNDNITVAALRVDPRETPHGGRDRSRL